MWKGNENGRGRRRKIRRERSRGGGSQNGKSSEGHINRRIMNKEKEEVVQISAISFSSLLFPTLNCNWGFLQLLQCPLFMTSLKLPFYHAPEPPPIPFTPLYGHGGSFFSRYRPLHALHPLARRPFGVSVI